MVSGVVGAPALSTLDDEPRNNNAADGPVGLPAARVPAKAGLTIEQQGAATRDAFRKDARLREAAERQDVYDARRTSGTVLKGAAAPGSEVGERTGLGVGYGVFDARYTPAAGEAPLERFGRGYSDKKRWTEEEAQDWQRLFSGLRDEWMAMHKTVRLFKVVWQGQELSRDAIVSVLQQVLEPVGVVQGNLAVYSEVFESRGVRPNGARRCWGLVVGCMSQC